MRPESGKALILVVDDEEDVRDLVREILRTAGFDTLPAGDGSQAVDVLRRRPDVDLVLTDVMMPHYDGPTLARRIERDWPGIPVLFMTGYPPETLRSLGMLPPGPAPIEKPFPIQDLLQRIRAALKTS
ncbi:MAG TPA: response regulator [Planctomycetota bacterium]|nr:response regulator [Planctomycetota bacterium]